MHAQRSVGSHPGGTAGRGACPRAVLRASPQCRRRQVAAACAAAGGDEVALPVVPAAANQPVKVTCARSAAEVVRGSLPRLAQIADLLGRAFYRDDPGNIVVFHDEGEENNIEQAAGRPHTRNSTWHPEFQARLWRRNVAHLATITRGWQLAAQQLWMHVAFADSTLTLLATTAGGERVVGTAVLQLKVTGKELQDACGCDAGLPVLILSNVAVAEAYRGIGIGRRIMHAAEEHALAAFGDANGPEHAGGSGNGKRSSHWAWWQTQPPVFMALIVYKHNTHAIRLYRSCGWREAVGWVDKAWVAEAERGKPGGLPRRLLFVLPLPGITPDAVLERLQ